MHGFGHLYFYCYHSMLQHTLESGLQKNVAATILPTSNWQVFKVEQGVFCIITLK